MFFCPSVPLICHADIHHYLHMEFDFCAKHEKFIIYGLNPIDEVARLEGLEVNGRLSSVFLGSTTVIMVVV